MSQTTTVAVLYGGRSTEHNISCISAGAIMSHLDPERFEVVPVGITRSGKWVAGTRDPEELKAHDGRLPEVTDGEEVVLTVNPERAGELTYLDGSRYARVDVVFPVLHGVFGEDGTMQGLFELSGVPYVGPGVLASACGMDKEFTKKVLSAAGLPVSAGTVLAAGRTLSTEDRGELGLPVFVKPARGGSSIGVSRVTDWADLDAALEEAFADDDKVLVEAETVGAEVEVGVLERPDGTVVASVPAKLTGTEDSDEGFYDFDAKYLDDVVHAEIPARIGEETTERLRQMAVTAFTALECSGLARVDFFVTDDGPVLNEVNTMPGFTPISMYPQVFRAVGVEYADLLATLIETARA
ncbi:D-alanine--D-alanine ligase [Corynebacterium frankenforstense DSM 45800]|uniref:D-alanine--D-alanine ligase n=1 Tax=Corynebacterium frankenforstense DSM 45800 TaxID=1437875 RepID=A0A1L7CSX4_9CORY|nr:D-alanine--D-alanine ligase family protein [Corynebacterium frankenforstense]APT88954.1 D-alanine--D-alanine ligase [Corynebacterium frankenforstense DSM 45800]